MKLVAVEVGESSVLVVADLPLDEVADLPSDEVAVRPSGVAVVLPLDEMVGVASVGHGHRD
jgi:hypothetical protein